MSSLLWIFIFGCLNLSFFGPLLPYLGRSINFPRRTNLVGGLLTDWLPVTFPQEGRQTTEPQLTECLIQEHFCVCYQIHMVGGSHGCQHPPLKARWLALEGGPVFNLSENLPQMFFPCLPPLLHPPHSDNSGFHGTEKGDRQSHYRWTWKSRLSHCAAGDRMQFTGPHTCCKTKNILATAGQLSTLNATFAVTKRFRSENGNTKTTQLMRTHLV